MHIFILIRHAQIIINDVEREDLDTLDEENSLEIRKNFKDFQQGFVLPVEKVEVWTSSTARTKLTGNIIGEVFGVKANYSEFLDTKRRPDINRSTAELIDFVCKRGKEVGVLLAVAHLPEILNFIGNLPFGVKFSDSKFLKGSDYWKGEGVIVDFDAKTANPFPRR